MMDKLATKKYIVSMSISISHCGLNKHSGEMDSGSLGGASLSSLCPLSEFINQVKIPFLEILENYQSISDVWNTEVTLLTHVFNPEKNLSGELHMKSFTHKMLISQVLAMLESDESTKNSSLYKDIVLNGA